MKWIPCSNNLFAVAIHNWLGDDIKFGLSLDVGDCVELIEEYGQWYRGKKSKQNGIFPKTYVHIRDASKSDPVVSECTQVLREWADIWKKLYVEHETYKFTTLRKVMLSLLESRRELLSAMLTQDQTLELQHNVISKIDWGNRKLGLDLVPRKGTQAVDSKVESIVALHYIHEKSAENAKASNSRGTLRKKSLKKALTHHLYFCMRDFGHRIGDDVEIYFYLYNGNTLRAVSERFLVKISNSLSNYIENLHSNCTVFTDLGNLELNSDLHLVANVLRIGKILHSDSIKKYEKTDKVYYRRPIGVGILSISEVMQFEDNIEQDEKEFSFKLFTCEEKDFHQLHELLIKKASGKFSLLNVGGPNTYSLSVSLKLLHGGLNQAKKDQPLLFQGTSITRKIGFADVIMPGDVRNDLFITLKGGDFERGGKSTAKNIEVTAIVLDSTGSKLNDCLFGASGMDSNSQYHSMIIYHNNSPCWNETLRLCVPIEKFSTAHVRFEFRHCSTRDKSEPKIFAFSFVRLMEADGATLSDKIHELYVYKCEDSNKLNSACYLKLQSSPFDEQASLDQSPMFNRSGKEVFSIKSVLCSTKLTQNRDLLALLQWKQHPEKISDALTRVLKLGDEELIKFLQDVLDALFSMFSTEDGNSTQYSGLVFHVLVSIFSLLKSNKYQHFAPVMDEYMNHFSAALVYKGLLSSVQHCSEWLTNCERPDPIQKCFQSLEYIFKLIIKSRQLFAEASGGQFEDSFKRDLFAVFISLNNMLTISSHDDKILPTQEALMHSLGIVFEQLYLVFSKQEIGNLIKNMLDAVPTNASPRLIQAKLHTIKDLVSGKLFHFDKTRIIILRIACKHLRIHLVRRDELKLCSEILGEILIHIYNAKESDIDQELDELCLNILENLNQTICIIMEGNSSVLCSLIAVLLGLLQQFDEQHYIKLWEEKSKNGNNQDIKELIHRNLLVFKELLSQDWQVYPNDWLLMKMSSNNIIRKSLEEFAKPLVFRFLNNHTFDSQLWCSYFSVAITFLTQPCLQLEQYHETKKRKILLCYGDMRVMMGFQILSMWSQLGEHKLHFIPTLVGPFLEVSLVPDLALRKATLGVFYDMINCEHLARGNFRLVESELIDKLDLLISENKGDEEYQQLFNTILLESIHHEHPHWADEGITFITSLRKLLERLLDYRCVMQGEENRDKRMTCTVNLLKFYKNEINRKEMYLRYIYKLHDLHVSAENFIEAGYTLKLYADMLNWDKEMLAFAPNGKETEQSECKEKLYHQIIDYFDKGKCWEKGVPLLKELSFFYETRRFDYVELSKTLNKEALFFQNILHQVRSASEYFRVGFYGQGFPSFVRNKEFVYRGLEYERIGTFTQKLQTEFPQAQILTKNTPPEQSIILSPGQYLQINNVRPISNPVHLRTATVPVPEHIASFYEVNDVSKFQYDRPIHKGVIDKDNEFKTLWIERTLLEIETPLPGILRSFEITKKSIKELTPIEFAVEIMENVQKELTDLINQYKANNRLNINPFSMRLQGIIDANVMGGISKYQEAFFSEAFAQSDLGQSQSMWVQRLKTLILEQMQILDTALELHGLLAPDGVQPLHKRLLERFQQLRQSLSGLGKIKKQYSIVNTPLPPIPFERAKSFNTDLREEDLYIKPNEAITFNYAALGIENKNRESLALPELVNSVPEKITRPKSTGYNSCLNDEPKSLNAPPLPPRGCKSNPIALLCEDGSLPIMSRHSQKYSVFDIALEDDSSFSFSRDSGISGSIHELNVNRQSCQNQVIKEDHSNACANLDKLNEVYHFEESVTPPPIPIKSGYSVSETTHQKDNVMSEPTNKDGSEIDLIK
ncbi:dedicator of cytokinesis protein 3 isoform X2 [Culicoides brevitarsis]|uniref:dedicator of cytokinesis protein 3 isoform X2 n=1 Tax=Culicoides brevitarsis TaxID=469753 RepID=UPI00307C81E8